MGIITGDEGWRRVPIPWYTDMFFQGPGKTYKPDGPILMIYVRVAANTRAHPKICSISFESESREGVIQRGEHFGDPDLERGDLLETVRIDTSKEQLQSIKMHRLHSIAFVTNLKTYGPFPNRGRSILRRPLPPRSNLGFDGYVIVGFHGTADVNTELLSGLGVYVILKERFLPIQEPADSAQRQKTEEELKKQIEELKTKINALEAENEELRKTNQGTRGETSKS